MRLVSNWRAVLCRSYAVHFGAVAFLFELLGTLGNVWDLFAGLLPIPPLAFAILGLVFALAGILGRFIKQPTVSGGSDADQ